MNLLSGNQSFVKTAISIGADFFAGYPITPASSIMTEWVKALNDGANIKFIQAEDELAAINMCIGASLAGSISFTATSGPGVSLMQESIGWAFVVEAPLVVVNSMRRGPSTGMPTLAGQGDILQTQFGTHGDVIIPTFYPNSIKSIVKMTEIAFVTAYKYGTPVYFLLDAYLSDLVEISNIKFNACKQGDKNYRPLSYENVSRYFTGLVNLDGVVDTHNISVYRKWLSKRFTKLGPLSKNKYFSLIKRNSKTLLLSFGIVSRVANELARETSLYDSVTLYQLYPIMDELGFICSGYDNVLVLEMNEGQYVKSLKAKYPNINFRGIHIYEIQHGYKFLQKHIKKCLKS